MSHGFELFSDIFAFRDSRLARLDPRVKLGAALSVMIAVLISQQLYLPLAAFACGLGAMLSLRCPIKLIAARMAIPLLMAGVICLMKTFLSGGEELFSLYVGPWELSASVEGLAEGMLVAARVLGSVTMLILLGLVTPAHKIFTALRWAHVPQIWVETAMLMYRYIFALLDQAANIFTAQQTRLGYVGLRRSLSSMGTLAGRVLERSMEQASRTHEAMVLRGYKGSIPLGKLPPIQRRDVTAFLVVIGTVALTFLLTEGYLL